MAPGYLRQRLIVPEMKKIRTLLPGFGFFMVSEKGEGQPLLLMYGVVAQIDSA